MPKKLQFVLHPRNKIILVAIIAIVSVSFCPTVSAYQFYGRSAFPSIPEVIDGNDFEYSEEDSFENAQPSTQSALERRSEYNHVVCGDGTRNPNFIKDYKRCGEYYKCDSAGNTVDHYCDGTKSYDEDNQKCVDNPPCTPDFKYPQNLGDFRCDKEFSKHGLGPQNCSDYYVCRWTGRYYTLQFKTCKVESTQNPGRLEDGYFSEFSKSCVPKDFFQGVCPQSLIPDPGKWCSSTGYQQSPITCAHYYKCINGHVLLTKCPPGQIYNNFGSNPSCIPGSCSVAEKKLPVNFPCVPDGKDNLHPTDCKKYYKCHACNNSNASNTWCYDHFESCGYEEFFDGILGKCISTATCPQNLKKLPSAEGYHCENHGERNAVPGDETRCDKFYTCVKCSKKGGWCIETGQCLGAQQFDQMYSICVKGGVKCPQTWTKVPDDIDCTSKTAGPNNQKPKRVIDPSKCAGYFWCFKCDRPWKICTAQGTCGGGQTFNPVSRICDRNPCRNGPDRLPNGWNCTHFKELNVNPTACKEFYKCVKCKDDFPWCVEHKKCPNANEWFNDKLKRCTKNTANVCPQELLPLPGNTTGWQCGREKDAHVNPEDCTEYFTCYKCEKSPNNWCYLPAKCSGGRFYDNVTKKCGNSEICPQLLTPLPIGEGWECTQENELNVVPDNCTDYYSCHACDRPRKWCYIRKSCPFGQTFDDIEQNCIVGRCPTYPPILPDKWKCEGENQLNVDPTNCQKYFQCVRCPDEHEWCYEAQECDFGQYFDDESKKCVVSTFCPQEYPELPSGPGWNCKKDRETNVHPKDCTQYYSCIRCDKPSGWCYEALKCGVGMFFDQAKKKCVQSRICPQNLTELPVTPGWNCELEDERNVVPDNCSSFYTCYQCDKPRQWCITVQSCPFGQTFDDEEDRCTPARCPSYPPLLPKGWNCSTVNELKVIPDDCTKSYKCIKCPDQQNPWCYELGPSCPPNLWFDDVLKQCVKGSICPQNLIEIGKSPEWDCTMEGEMNVLPKACSKFYTCISCSKPRKWCYAKEEHCPVGSNFDQFHRQCTPGICPQSRPEIQDGAKCRNDKELHVHPTDCVKYYSCHKCLKPKGWCYEEHKCASKHTFDDTRKTCVEGRCPQLDPVIPPDWKCTKHGEVNVVPSDCSKHFTCLSCPGGPWCYKKVDSCPAGQTFDNAAKRCVVGRCPQYPPVLPGGRTCGAQGEQNVHPIYCSSFYTCFTCPDSNKWCYTLHKCGNGKTFDNARKTCVEGRCPQLDPLLPSTWKCNKHGEVNVEPNDCSKHFTCVSCPDGPWCYNKHESCPEGHTFDNTAKRCVNGRCPQYPPILPTGWSCKTVGEQNVHPADCYSFYTCATCPDNHGWCYSLTKCGGGQFFDNKAKQCVKETKCPQEVPLLPPGWKCNQDGEKNVHPEDCTKFYTCKRHHNSWTYTEEGCPAGQYFNENTKACWVGSYCPQDMTLRCQVEAWKIVIPGKCNMYYQCWYVTRGGVSFWELTEYTCQSGYTFDEFSQKCVKGGCRIHTEYNPTPRPPSPPRPPSQPRPPSPPSPKRPPLPKGWKCGKDSEKRVHPDDCSKYYTCIWVPDSTSKKRGYWTYTTSKCGAGKIFNENRATCKTGQCLRRRLTGRTMQSGDIAASPPKLTCVTHGELMVHPQDCRSYYKCIRADSGWTYQHKQCLQGKNFDNGKKSCVSGPCPQSLVSLPENWMCKASGATEVHPEDCSQYYTCMRCMGGTVLGNGEEVEIIGEDTNTCLGGIGTEAGTTFWATGAGTGTEIQTECGWCYRGPHKCPKGHMYSTSVNGCVSSKTCPQSVEGDAAIIEEYPEIPLPLGVVCEAEEELVANPRKCVEYYMCILNGNQWSVSPRKCGKRQHFSVASKSCVEGKCNRGKNKYSDDDGGDNYSSYEYTGIYNSSFESLSREYHGKVGGHRLNNYDTNDDYWD